MSIQQHFATIPVYDSGDHEAELNRFLRARRVVTINRELVHYGRNSFWAVSVEYLDGKALDITGNESVKSARKGKVDYRDVLPPEEFAVFARLRDWRKEEAMKEGVPVYMIFTNEQLANIVQNKISTNSDLGKIDGVGDSRVEKYGSAVLSVLNVANGTPVDKGVVP